MISDHISDDQPPKRNILNMDIYTLFFILLHSLTFSRAAKFTI